MNVTAKFNEDKILTIFLEGAIDSANAAEAEEIIMEIYQTHDAKAVVLDAEKLRYVSSSGLRVFLMMAKRLGSEHLLVDNANELVREIFETTGFSDVVTVR